MSKFTLFRLKNQMFFFNLVGISFGVLTFFILEFVLQRAAPYFFPKGGLYVNPKTPRVRIRTRLAALIFACNLIPFLALIVIVRGSGPYYPATLPKWYQT